MQLFAIPSPTADFADFADRGGQVVASYPTYGEAQQAIDRLADSAFPVQESEIVGRDLRLVERVTGRMTDGHAAAAGAATGAWFGLLVGLLVGLFTFAPAWLGLILGGLLIGILWGALFGLLAHRMGSGRHDFASMRSIAASRYEVIVSDQHADHAKQLLSPLGADHQKYPSPPTPESVKTQETTMTPTISYRAVQAHLDDLHRDARRQRGYQRHVPEMLRHAPARHVKHQIHLVPAASRR